MVLTIGVEPITSSLPWNCSAIGAMQAKRANVGIEGLYLKKRGFRASEKRKREVLERKSLSRK